MQVTRENSGTRNDCRMPTSTLSSNGFRHSAVYDVKSTGFYWHVASSWQTVSENVCYVNNLIHGKSLLITGFNSEIQVSMDLYLSTTTTTCASYFNIAIVNLMFCKWRLSECFEWPYEFIAAIVVLLLMIWCQFMKRY